MSSNRSKTTGSIVAYKLVPANLASEMNDFVRKLLDEGWKVHGSPCCCPTGDDTVIYQAMVRYSEPDSGLKG